MSSDAKSGSPSAAPARAGHDWDAAELASRRRGRFGVRIECELLDAGGEMGGLLVLLPD